MLGRGGKELYGAAGSRLVQGRSGVAQVRDRRTGEVRYDRRSEHDVEKTGMRAGRVDGRMKNEERTVYERAKCELPTSLQEQLSALIVIAPPIRDGSQAPH